LDNKRRTNPSFLSKDEAAREARRTEAMVRGITGEKQPRNKLEEIMVDPLNKPKSSAKEKSAINLSHITRVGETNYFSLDYHDNDKVVALYGKEVPKDSPFVLKLSLNETVAITRLLGKSLEIMRNNPQTMRVGEKDGFVVDFDSYSNRTLLYQREKTVSCPFRLAFDEYETMMIIHFLKKARNFFWH
jgi:hypothetical protein